MTNYIYANILPNTLKTMSFTCQCYIIFIFNHIKFGGRPGRDHMVVGFITTYAISAYHH
jgi:hypothetical protein